MMAEQIQQKDVEIARLRAALEWYADRNNYQSPCDCCEQDASIIIDDGTRARDALGITWDDDAAALAPQETKEE